MSLLFFDLAFNKVDGYIFRTAKTGSIVAPHCKTFDEEHSRGG